MAPNSTGSSPVTLGKAFNLCGHHRQLVAEVMSGFERASLSSEG